MTDHEFQELKADIAANGLLEPIVTFEDKILDGRHRYKACADLGIEPRFTPLPEGIDPLDYAIATNLHRRHLTASQRAAIGADLLEYEKERARERQGTRTDLDPNLCEKVRTSKKVRASDQAAAQVKSNPRYVEDAAKVREHEPEVFEQVKAGRKSLRAATRDLKKKFRLEALPKAPADSRILVGDFREQGENIPDASLSLIFTDPPYNRQASKMLPDLAAFAEAKLAEGGSLLCYVGQTQLPTALDAFRERLRYWWIIACIHSGGKTVMREYGINAGWKAVLWFVKGTRLDTSIMVSDMMSGGREKSHHEWQQAEAEAMYWIENLCPPNGVVCDPFLGSGTTAVAAEHLNRSWVGIELDPVQAQVAAGRLTP